MYEQTDVEGEHFFRFDCNQTAKEGLIGGLWMLSAEILDLLHESTRII